MSPLKLLFFVGVSVAMMVSVHGIVDHDDDSSLPPFEKDKMMNDENVSEDYEENATLFDEAATTFSPEEDWSDDVAFDEDVNEDYGRDAIIFDEPAVSVKPVSSEKKGDLMEFYEYLADLYEQVTGIKLEDFNEDSANHVDSQEFYDRLAYLIAKVFGTGINLFDEDVNEDYAKDAVIFDEPVVKPVSSEKHDDSPGFFKHLEDLFTMIYGPGMNGMPRSDEVAFDEDVNEDYAKDAVIFDEPAVEPMSSEKHVDSPEFYKHISDLFTIIFGMHGMHAHPKPTQPTQPKDQENNKA